MISASHNAFEDNGIKLFGPDGFKLSDEIEYEIEQLMDGSTQHILADSAKLARGAKGEDPFGLRGEFVQLVELAQSLQTPQNVQVRAD